MALYEACEDDSDDLNRIHINLISTWNQQTCIELTSTNCETLKNNRALLNTFMSSLSVKVEEMELQSVPMEFLRICENFCLPSVQILSCTLDDSRSRVEAQRILTHIFPGVRCMKPDLPICYCSMSKWTQFRELIVVHPYFEHHTYHFCFLGQLPSIEELVAPDVYIINHSFQGFMHLPNLRTITIRVSDEFANRNDPLYDPLITLMGIDQYGGTEGNTDNIRGLMLDGVWCIHYDLCNEVRSFRNLVRLDLDRRSCSTEICLWEIVAQRPSLEILDITRMDLGCNFFSLNRYLMNITMHNRHAPLTVIYANIGENEGLIRRHFTHPQLQLISGHKKPKNVLGPIIKLELTPLYES
ncbi:uncharacterized protein LOC117573628 isoform X2 [Drosophila albomicans]|nr:uncharacterized protein LOC117573628 isoform X2 [Drosophila albomicans]